MIHCIGDSHSSVFCGKEEMQPIWPIRSDDTTPYFKSYRIGPATAYQLSNKTTIIDDIIHNCVDIQNDLAKSTASDVIYPKTELAKNLEWISKLIKGNLNSKVYYTSLGGFDTHDNQLAIHKNKLSDLNDAVYSFYQDLKKNQLLQNVTIVVFSEFGRRVKDNGRGTDHGTAAPMFIIGGNNQGKVIGKNPNLSDLNNGDLKHEVDFRSVYASLLQSKLNFDASKIGIKNKAITGLF